MLTTESNDLSVQQALFFALILYVVSLFKLRYYIHYIYCNFTSSIYNMSGRVVSDIYIYIYIYINSSRRREVVFQIQHGSEYCKVFLIRIDELTFVFLENPR